MRIRIDFEVVEQERVPINYNYYIQAWIYRHLEGRFGTKLHELKGPKLFTFSQLFFEKYNVDNGWILPEKETQGKLYVASVNDDLLGYLGKAVSLSIGNIHFPIKKVELIPVKIGHKFDTLSPINVTYSDGKERVDIPPDHPLFYERLKENLLKKYQIVYREPYNGELIIDPSSITHIKEKRIKVKNTFHRAYHMKNLVILADEKMLRLVLDAGLGERNSMGFGMVMSK